MAIVYANVPNALPLDFSTLRLTDEQFYQLCLSNPEQPLELTNEGALIIMSPVGGESGKRELTLGMCVGIWNLQTQLGEVFSSSTIFKLPLGAQRSPDVAWIEKSRWDALTLEEQKRFPPIAPDFIIELRSESDRLADLREKMLEYKANGVRLGLLVDPKGRQVEIYRTDRDVEILENPGAIDCNDVLPGFTLDLQKIWS